MRAKEFTEANSYQPPQIDVGDEVRVGKFKNRKAEVTGFKSDDNNQPVLKTTKGDQKLFKPRISKLMNENLFPAVLYHGTYKPLLRSIKQHGLGGKGSENKRWEDSTHGVVYLASSPDVAESYAESSEAVPDEWLDEIIILSIQTTSLDKSKLQLDQNVQDNLGDTYEYVGVIPMSAISLGNYNKLNEESKSVFYHVTQSTNVPKIQKKGILAFQPTNWVQAGNKERYGDGSIFAFDHKTDAIRWAAKWDWDLTKSMGSGKVSIISFHSDPTTWETDTADPLGQGGRSGTWLKSMQRIPPEQIIDSTPVTVDMIRSIR